MGFPDEREVLITYLLEMAMVMCRCEKFGNGKRRSLSRELNLFSQETFLGLSSGPFGVTALTAACLRPKTYPTIVFTRHSRPRLPLGIFKVLSKTTCTPLPPALITPSSRLPLPPASPSFAAKPYLSHPLTFKMGKCIRPPPVARPGPQAPGPGPRAPAWLPRDFDIC